jgi:hypothetical protein
MAYPETMSCADGPTCVVGGEYWNGSTDEAFLDQWTGSDWLATEIPVGRPYADLYVSVSCGTRPTCIANYFGGGESVSSFWGIEELDAGTWRAANLAIPGDGYTAFTAACGSSSQCIVLGRYYFQSDGEQGDYVAWSE